MNDVDHWKRVVCALRQDADGSAPLCGACHRWRVERVGDVCAFCSPSETLRVDELLARAERDPLAFPPRHALILSGRRALPDESAPGEVARHVFDVLDDWGPLPTDQVVESVVDDAGNLTPGMDATYDRELTAAVVRGLLRDGYLVPDESGRVRLPWCTLCKTTHGDADGCGSPTMDPCRACAGRGTVRPDERRSSAAPSNPFTLVPAR